MVVVEQDGVWEGSKIEGLNFGGARNPGETRLKNLREKIAGEIR